MSKDLDKQIAELKKVSDDLDKQVAEAKLNEENSQQEKPKVETPPPPKPFNVYGCDFSVTEPNIVEYYKNRLKMMVIQYKLVGKFDEEGNYVIPKEVKYELVEMQKEIEEMGSDYYKVSTHFMKKYFNFTIKLTMLEDGQAKASLSLAEYAGQTVAGETIYTHIGDFVDVYDADFRIKLRKAFNLVDVDAKNNDFDIPNLAVIMQDLIDTDIYIGGLYDMASQIYVMRMLKLLENGGEREREILERYKDLVAQMEEEEGKAVEENDKFKIKRRKNLNEKRKELLDKAIDEKGGLEKLNIDKKELKGCVDELNKTDKAINELSTACAGVLDIEEIKNLKTGKEASKGGGGSSPAKKPAKKAGGGGGGGGGKKKPAKKAKKGDDKEKKKTGGGVFWVPASDFKPEERREKPEEKDEKPAENDDKPQPPAKPVSPNREQPVKTPPKKEEDSEEKADDLLDGLLSEHENKQAESDAVTKIDENIKNIEDATAVDKIFENVNRNPEVKDVLDDNLIQPPPTEPKKEEINLDEFENEM